MENQIQYVDSDLYIDQRASTNQQQQYTAFEQTHKNSQFQKTEKTIGNNKIKQLIHDDLPDLMQDSEEGVIRINSNLNNTNKKTTHSGQVIGGNQTGRNSHSYLVNSNSIQTGGFRQLFSYHGSSLVNAIQTADFQPDDASTNLYQEGITGRMSAKIKCKNCDKIIQTLVKFEPGQATNICSIVLCLLTCTLCCFPFLIDQCKDAVHYCPHCGVVVGVKKF